MMHASALVLCSLLSAPCPAAPQAVETPVLRLEAEQGVLSGAVRVEQAGSGFSGGGYVTGFGRDEDRVAFEFQARAGVHELRIRYRSAVKGFLYELNGVALSAKFADSKGVFAEQALGRVELAEGLNRLSIHGGWKGYEIDGVELRPVGTPPVFPKPAVVPCNPDSSPAARALLAYLVDNYGTRTLSGTIEGPDVDYVREVTGQLPAIIAGDLININSTTIRYAGVVGGETERMIERAREGHILTYCWHWRPPTGVLEKPSGVPGQPGKEPRWYGSFYTRATTFDVEKTLAHPESREYALMMTDIDMVAGELRKFQEWGIPILWRPLHESEGLWFWWGAKGPGPFKALWRLVYDRFTRVHKLNHLIWVYTGTANPDWYPGDEVVDIIGIDDYPADVRDPLSPIWEEVQARFGSRKLIALSEFGGVPDLARAKRLGIGWSYFASWSKELGPMKMERGELKRLYNDPLVINHGELPRDRWQPFKEKLSLEAYRPDGTE